MNRNNQGFLSQLRLQNVLGGLGIRTSADIFEAAQKQYEEARNNRQFGRQRSGRQGGVPCRAVTAVVATTEEDVSKVRSQNGLAGLGIRTWADVFEDMQKQHEEARNDRRVDRQWSRRKGGVPSRAVVAATQEDAAQGGQKRKYVSRTDRGQPKRARTVDTTEPQRPQCARTVGTTDQGLGGPHSAGTVGTTDQGGPQSAGTVGRANQEWSKHARTVVCRERSDAEQIDELARVLQHLEEEFAEKERLSHEQTWCAPIPSARKVSTVQKFYKAFHDKNTLPTHTCKICYLKFCQAELQEVGWERWMASHVEKRNDSPFKCGSCFPVGQGILACVDCVKHLRRGTLSRAAQLHTQLGCEHMFPDELKGLTPVEEKLIALNSCYGFMTKYSVPKGQRQNVTYPKHVKGHITVFPNNVQELVTNILPHPLLKVMDEIHVSWQGKEKPAPSDLSALLSVRRRVVERALVWLKRHNPLYANITIDTAEMDSWEAPGSAQDVPFQVYERLERNEPSAWEKVQTGQVVPPTERGLEEDGPTDIREIMAALEQERDKAEEEGCEDGEESEGVILMDLEESDNATETIHEISSSGMFALDARPDVADTEKLQYVCDALGQDSSSSRTMGSSWSAQVRHHQHGHGASEPFIVVSRGEEFADSSVSRFFAKTFPTLFPVANGGPRQAEESNVDVAIESNAMARKFVSSRNMSLETWARLVLQRHGGRFANHHVFAFLVFNMMVKSRNRRVSMLSVTRKNFADVERIVRSLSVERLERAKKELKDLPKSTDEAVNKLLSCLSLYGLRQPMSREDRLSMRRKLKSLIIRYGFPAIWFTLNPNDITNPVKLRLAAYRSREPEEAEEFLRSLDLAYKRARLAISDPVGSAIFFHREISMFFEHYVQTGQDSVFGRISQYFGAVETNERGALHVHGLLWLQGNMNLGTILKDVVKEGQEAYREAIIQYVDSVFTEVSFVILSLR